MKSIYLGFILLFIHSLVFSAGDTIELAIDHPIEGLELPYIYDSLNNYTADQLVKMWGGHDFSQSSQFNQYTGQYWSIFTLKNQDDFESEWILTVKDWKEVTVYEETSGGYSSGKKTGYHIPFNQRDYAFADNNHLHFTLQPLETRKFVICLKAGADHWRMPSDTRIELLPKDVQDYRNHRDELIMGIFAGIFLFLFLYNLFIYFSTKDFEYLLFLARILILGYTINANSGYVVAWFSGIENFPHYKALVGSIMSGLGPTVMIIFTMSFLNTKENLPRWHSILKWLMFAVLIMVVGVNINYKVFGPITYLISMILVASFIIVGVKSIIKQVPSSWYYLMAYIFSTTAMFIVIFSFSGLLPRNTFTMNYVLPTGYSLELLFFSFALANKINILRKKTDSQQNEIIKHLQEKEELQKGITKELERKVEERTKEINQQKELIEIERQKSEKLLMNILPEEAVQELKEKGFSSPKAHNSVTILFSDFKGFTHIASDIPTDKLIAELNDLFHHFDEIMEANGVEKIKTIGDAYMSVAGLYDADENHAHKCIQAGIDIQKYLAKRNVNSEILWEVRIGVHTGSVISGIVGKNKFTFDVWGDAVNVASRLESLSEIGQINVSAKTFDMAKDKFSGRYRGKIDAKGKGKMDMYYIDFEVNA